MVTLAHLVEAEHHLPSVSQRQRGAAAGEFAHLVEAEHHLPQPRQAPHVLRDLPRDANSNSRMRLHSSRVPHLQHATRSPGPAARRTLRVRTRDRAKDELGCKCSIGSRVRVFYGSSRDAHTRAHESAHTHTHTYTSGSPRPLCLSLSVSVSVSVSLCLSISLERLEASESRHHGKRNQSINQSINP